MSAGRRFSKLVGDNGSTIPPIIQVPEFFLARAPEVVKLYNSLSLKSAIVPNHKRRRMRSFKPWNLAPKLGKSAAGFPRLLSRRTRRLRRMYLQGDQVGGEKKYLPATHVWHAKRFRMENVWNMRLPTKVNGKGHRSIVRMFNHQCLLHDRSYMDHWVVSGDSVDAVVAKLRMMGVAGVEKFTRSGLGIKSGLIVSDDLVTSPYQVIWPPQQLDGVFAVDVWTHAAARVEITPLMEKVGSCLNKRTVRYELLGARALEVLNRVFPYTNSVPGELSFLPNGASVHSRRGGTILDIFVPASVDPLQLWVMLERAGGSPIGVFDRHAMMAELSAPDFPFDFPCSKAGARISALIARDLIGKEQKLPPQCRMDTSSVESAFFPDWSLVGCQASVPTMEEMRPVLIDVTKGTIHHNAHVYVHDKLVGYVTSTRCRPNGRALALMNASMMNDSDGKVAIHNPGTTARRDGVMRACKVSSTDSIVLGLV